MFLVAYQIPLLHILSHPPLQLVVSGLAAKTVQRRHSQPRFPKIQVNEDETRCTEWSNSDKVSSRVLTYKSQLVVQLRRVLLEESSVFKTRGSGNNPYNVQYVGPRGSYVGKSVQELVCGLKKKVGRIRTISALDEPFTAQGLRELFPKTPIFTEKYNTCAIVTNAGSLSGSGLGTFIGELFSILHSTIQQISVIITEHMGHHPLEQPMTVVVLGTVMTEMHCMCSNW